ncbi:hypothetical protein KAH81_10315 [bacterium]|nr:hypothetical protein [bacterium]
MDDTPGRAYGVYVSCSYAYVADGGDGLYILDISYFTSLEVEINPGWNLLSVPSSTPQPWTIYGNIPYGYDPSIADYVVSDSLHPGEGYFVLNTAPDTVEIPRGLFSYTDTLYRGWNLLGGLDHATPSHSFITTPPGIALSLFYGWDGSAYFFTDSLHPGRGYWFLSSGHGRITVGP